MFQRQFDIMLFVEMVVFYFKTLNVQYTLRHTQPIEDKKFSSIVIENFKYIKHNSE